MPDAPMPAQGQGEAPQGGGIVEALTATDKSLFQITQAVAKNDQIPDEIKSAFQTALQAFRQGLEGLTNAAGGGGGDQPQAPQPSTPEQGGSGAQPMSMRRPG